jgi:hypothetical protein
MWNCPLQVAAAVGNVKMVSYLLDAMDENCKYNAEFAKLCSSISENPQISPIFDISVF